MSREQIVPAGAAAERLDVYLAAVLGETRSAVARQLKAGSVTVNGRPARSSYLVQPGDRIGVAAPSGAPSALGGRSAPAPGGQPISVPDLPIVYQDADLLVIDKPAGQAAHPAPGLDPAEPTVADFARSHTTDPDPDRPGIVHRLDRDTSGLMMIAKTPAAKAALQQAFRDRAIHKTYTLLVAGRVDPPQAVIKLPLDRDPARPLRRAVVPGGRPAVTAYRTLATYPGYTLIEARPQTGRTHQLRVHFAALGHPIVGDNVYGAGGGAASRAKTPAPALGLKRQFLHATALEFTAPSGARLSLHSPLPPDLAAVVQTLEKRL